VSKKRKNKQGVKDPHAKREAEKYSNPVPSREFLLAYFKKNNKPVTLKAILKDLHIETDEEREGIRRRLIAMERDGQILRNRKNAYITVQDLGFIRGYVIGHKDGFGFLTPEDGGNDLFISAREMRQVFDGDKVLARVAGIDHRGRKDVAIVEVLERNTQQIVGRLIHEDGAYLVIPDNPKITQDILIPTDKLNKAKAGEIVVAELLAQPTKRSIPMARVVEVLGEQHAPGLEVDIAIRAYELPHTWPEDVIKEVSKIPAKVATKDKAGRLDLRDLSFVTIDGEDAKDFDDAVYCEKRKGGWKLYVAIADVAHYVKPGTALDDEARVRGNSVYFPDRVIPMLPEILSNGLCSLNPKVDRLCMVCIMNLDTKGQITSYKFDEGIIRSQARLTYNKVAKMLVDKDKELIKQYKKVFANLEYLYEVFKLLHRLRLKRGAIELEIPETKIIFNENRKIDRVEARYRNDAHRLIEECMLAANVCTADYLLKRKIPAVYRNHLGPNEDKLANLREFLGELNLSIKGGDKPQPKDYSKVLSKIGDRPDSQMIQTVLLRSLSQAVYHADNEGHFGLAYDAYTHFTSPIRRYPDLLVHRALKHLIKKQNVKKFIYDHDKMNNLGAHCSMTERRADDATRNAIEWLKCEYMVSKIGEKFHAVITGVTNFGVFVALDGSYIEGLVHITALKNDVYEFDAVHHRLMGKRTRQVYRLGDPLYVRVMKVNLDDRKIDFELV